ncbi:uncharacterized protein CANTADRAFT_6810 [Suhomyces tanzawaensis NRRL Y-17324]|uniref:F-box domain-containing protein n=1 Tax=Suhomyces tanzawaensis NRRL Y-17324 TaxID=984487 RepID=A0A1E4SFY0_9ASCO|nr:uncharacterized protein CANTADRAFT_6810 [Suhomyces tanzawaensis NRRL Y-17324]ODV78419.1 hypothetical protein CANTADRAFT_6810 [Suhomyces tanzawaensis NRRL Y-17324]
MDDRRETDESLVRKHAPMSPRKRIRIDGGLEKADTNNPRESHSTQVIAAPFVIAKAQSVSYDTAAPADERFNIEDTEPYLHDSNPTTPLHPFLKIPTDILQVIIKLIDPNDLINLSTTSKEFRQFLLPYIFNRIRIEWLQIDDDFKYCYLVKQLRIVDCNSYGEWHVDVFDKLDRFSQLQHFLINSSNSSNWLKYRSNQCMKALTLYYDKTQTLIVRGGSVVRNNGAGAVVNSHTYAIPGDSVHVGGHLTGNTSGSPRIFSLGHVHQFLVTSLTLYNYHFNWEPQDPITSNVVNLTIHDCTWEYPFTISQFNLGQHLKTLDLCYSTNNSFILSERFNKFLLNDDESTLGNFDSLDSLSIVFLTRKNSWDKVLSLKQLLVFLSKYPSLTSLKLRGWSVNTLSLMLIFRNFKEHKLKMLDLELLVPKNHNRREVEDTKLMLKTLYPWTKVKLKAIES